MLPATEGEMDFRGGVGVRMGVKQTASMREADTKSCWLPASSPRFGLQSFCDGSFFVSVTGRCFCS